MSVKLIDNKAFYGYRTRRTINGMTYQEYFSLVAHGGKHLSPRSAAGKKVLKEAEARDTELIAIQVNARNKRRLERGFRSDGSVSGISYLIKQEKSGVKTPIFQLGLGSLIEHKVISRSVSLTAHGKEAAWLKIVEKYAEHKKINKNSKLYKKLLGSMVATMKHKRRTR